MAANVCGYMPLNLGKIIKDGVLSDIPSIHRITIDGATMRRYKEGCAPSIAEEYQDLPEKETIGTDIEFENQIMFYDHNVNLIYTMKNEW